MKLSVSKDECDSMSVDRDSVRSWHGRQGFEIWIGGVLIHFEDELDAERMAEMVLIRLGKLPSKNKE